MRYFFHFEHRDGRSVDRVGRRLEIEGDVLLEAIKIVDGLIVDPRRLCDWGSAAMRVEREDGGFTVVLPVAALLNRPLGRLAA